MAKPKNTHASTLSQMTTHKFDTSKYVSLSLLSSLKGGGPSVAAGKREVARSKEKAKK